MPKGELELYESFSDLSAMRAGRRGPRSLHLRTQDLVDLPVDELSDKYVQAMPHVQVMASMLTGIHNVDESPVAGSYRLVSEADWDRRCRSQKKAKRKVRTLRAQLGRDLDEDQFSTTSSSDSLASEGTRAADRERRKKRSKAKRQRLATEQAMKDEAQREKIKELHRKLEELEKERAAVPATGGAQHAARTDAAPEVAAPVCSMVPAPVEAVALEEAVGHGWAVSSVWVRDSLPATPPPPPPPLRALRAHLVTKGQWLRAIHMVAPKAPENFFHSPCQHSIPPRPGGGAPQRYT